MPDPRTQFVVKGTRSDGAVCFWTASLGGHYPEFLRDRARAYPLSREGAREVATRFNVSNTGLAGFQFDTEPYVLT